MKLLSILGPTASGKSSVAIELARILDGEIVSCDSMQIYKGLDIGTAKITSSESRGVPHHLIDGIELEERYSVVRFIADADRVIQDVISRGRQPILCGGTGLYAKALLYGFDCRPSDRAIADELRSLLESEGPDALLDELRRSIPDVAETIGDNPRHWLRALEVVRITGRPPERQEEFVRPDYAAPEFILMPPPELSRSRIRARTIAMLNAGWLEETRAISERFLASATATQALGYSFVIDHLSGRCSFDEMVEKIVIATARYAKRQRTWFRNQHPLATIIPIEDSDTTESIAAQILAHVSNGS